MDSGRDQESLLESAIERSRRVAEHDEELQRLAPLSETRERLLLDARSSIECLVRACELYADRPCFSERAPELRITSYAELWSRVEATASGLRHEHLADTGAFVGICGFGSVDWVVADLACLYLAAVSVPIQTSASPTDLRNILNDAGLRCIVCSLAQLELLASVLPDCPTVESLVVMDVDEQDRSALDAWALAQQTLQEEHGADLRVLRLSEVEQLGRRRGLVPYVEPSRRHAAEPDPLMTLMYTSGSTGSPKGAMFSESIWRSMWRSPSFGRFPSIPHVSVNYMPLNHLAGRNGIVRSIRIGGLTSFVSRSDMSTLFEDIRLARPTSLMLIPRAASMIYQHFQSELVKRAVARGIDRHDLAGRERVAAEIMGEMRGSFLGDRLVYAVGATAPTAPEVRDFIERCFEIPFFDVYGSTEAGGISFNGRILTEVVTAFKIVSVAELGYRTTDEPFPRGELCIKSPRIISGYYRNPDATRELFDKEGYLKTGDIVEQRGPDELAWIDRKKNVLKLAQGEFVSTTQLEELYAAGSPFIRQIHLHGNSLRSYLLAVIVPEPRAVEGALRKRGIASSGAAVKALIREELNRIAMDAQVKSYEIPRDFLVEPEPFTRKRGLLTESNKPMRARLKARYGAELESLYEEIERRQLEDLQALAQQRGGEASVEPRVRKAMMVTLGLHDLDVAETLQSFIQLGGDSLSAVRLAELIRDLCGVDVPVGLLLDPTLRVSAVVRYVEERLSGRPSAHDVTFEQIHGAGAEIVRADDLRLDRFLGPDDFEAAAKAVPATALPREARVTLLTGANGFLGRFLAFSLLEGAARSGGEVVCIVRAPSDVEALERFNACYRGSDPALLERFQALSAGRLTVLQGDLMKPRLGLTDDVYDRVCEEVDSIVHNGALVNHTFSYPQLFEPNVLGTVELMRVAIRRRIKALGFVSSVGVGSGLGRRDPIREDEDGRALWQERPIDSGYAVGYATSKWACEVLLRELSGRFAVPVEVFRCSMILPHRQYLGQVNVSDFLTRLLLGVVVTGLAPRSFYAGEAGRAHFDGLPVDFVAGSIAAIASVPREGLATYHVVNAHWDDGVSLDRLVDWVVSAGYAVTRVEDHAEWYAAFRERLLALPPELQQCSPLPILHQWARPIPADAEARFDARRLRERLSELTGEAVALPRVDERFVHAYLKDLVALGLIGKPKARPLRARLRGVA